ncbi:hypothetical protein TNCT_546741 [Trichonephila clavata]|uniref:Uncharacterized protein n=1 Tax=Trichonephila clavata TaxID=2740835 RepID=A0A8X6KLR6_TRICU|nr:hypothetical protein TNCT_546741 [Trichonephila clavata]
MSEKARKTFLRLFSKIWNGVDVVSSQWKNVTITLLENTNQCLISSATDLQSLISSQEKLLEIGRFGWFLETKRLLHHAQIGFQIYCATEEQVAFFFQSIKNTIDKGNIVCAVFVDFKGANDTI